MKNIFYILIIFPILIMGTSNISAQPVADTECGVDCPSGEGKCYCCDEFCNCTQTDVACGFGEISYCDDDLDGQTAVQNQCALDEGIPLSNTFTLLILATFGFSLMLFKTRIFSA